MRKQRKGEYICTCSAYAFPHKFGGGRCHGLCIPESYWADHYGTGSCQDCVLLDFVDGLPSCQVIDGLEKVTECPLWQEHVSSYEIRLHGPYWRSLKI